MSIYAGSGKRARAMKPFWKKDAFWFVVMPTSLVAAVFLFGMVVKALGY